MGVALHYQTTLSLLNVIDHGMTIQEAIDSIDGTEEHPAVVHLPAAVWGAIVEWTQTVCPLTTLENHLRRLRGLAGYKNGFIEYHITRVLYPDGLTQRMQIALGVFVVLLNVTVYTIVFLRRRRRGAGAGASDR